MYVFVVIEHGSRRLIHCNVTAHPSAAWTLQQLREVVGYGDRYRFLIHDRDCIFASKLDESIRALGIRVSSAFEWESRPRTQTPPLAANRTTGGPCGAVTALVQQLPSPPVVA